MSETIFKIQAWNLALHVEEEAFRKCKIVKESVAELLSPIIESSLKQAYNDGVKAGIFEGERALK